MTAISTGTATDYLDLFDKFRTFITSHSALVSAGEAWTELRYSTTEAGTGTKLLMLRGPGLSSGDQIYVNLHTHFSVGSDYFNWQLSGAAGYSSGSAYNDQPGQTGAAGTTNFKGVNLLLINASMPYWFIADGRCFKILVKVSTIYQHAIAGLFLPYATPGEYPYPLIVGAMSSTMATRWSAATHLNSAWFEGYQSLFTRWVDGTWYKAEGINTSNNLTGVNGTGAGNYVYGVHDRPKIRPAIDGSYLLEPLTLVRTVVGTEAVYGEIPGVFGVSGLANSSENTISIGGKTYLVMQNAYRTTQTSYVAYLLE